MLRGARLYSSEASSHHCVIQRDAVESVELVPSQNVSAKKQILTTTKLQQL